MNPLNLDPLRNVLTEQIDFDRLRRRSKIALFIAATRVRDAALRIFSTHEMSAEALLASACLPSLTPAVEVDGEAYWDGALVANPPLSVLAHRCKARDIVVVALDAPREGVPATPRAIRERVAEITFSSALATELHAIAVAKSEAQRARFPLGRLERRLRRLKVHVIESPEYMAQLDLASRFNTRAAFLAALPTTVGRVLKAGYGKIASRVASEIPPLRRYELRRGGRKARARALGRCRR